MGSLSLEGRFIIPKTMPSEATVSVLMGVRNIPKEPKSNSLVALCTCIKRVVSFISDRYCIIHMYGKHASKICII